METSASFEARSAPLPYPTKVPPCAGDNYLQFFRDTVDSVGPLMASDDPNLGAFRDRGGKLVMWHGFADQLIVPGGTIDYYDRVTRALGGGYERTQRFARLFMAPGVAHCGGGGGPQPQGLFNAVVDWVENEHAPERISRPSNRATGRRSTASRGKTGRIWSWFSKYLRAGRIARFQSPLQIITKIRRLTLVATVKAFSTIGLLMDVETTANSI